MNSKELIAAIEQYAKEKHINKPMVAQIINEVFSALILKEFGTVEKFSIVVNPKEGDLQIFRTREIVADDAPDRNDPDKITLSEARKKEADFMVGEEMDQEIPLSTFRLRAQTKALQVFRQKTREIENLHLQKKYERRVGEIITVEVRHKTPNYIIMSDDERNELILPKRGQIPRDHFYIGQQVPVLVEKVEQKERGMVVVLSRTAPLFLEKLLWMEIPEIKDGTVLIHKVVRRPGIRAKVTVSSQDDRIDPIGAIVGLKGSRIAGVREQICYEAIDIVQYTDNWELYVARALAPAKVKHMTLQEEQVNVFLPEDQVPLAIGSKGQNIYLASQLIGFHINIESEEAASEDDVALEDFADEIQPNILHAFKALGLHTGRAVLALTPEALAEQTHSDIESVTKAYQVIQKEFQK